MAQTFNMDEGAGGFQFQSLQTVSMGGTAPNDAFAIKPLAAQVQAPSAAPSVLPTMKMGG
ncbi:MAG: hypothetical protein WC043_09915 [Pseudobdellovibrionaceae bacterium]